MAQPLKRAEGDWALPRRKSLRREALDRAIAAEERLAPQEHQARAAWFDRRRDIVLIHLADGRVFGAERAQIPSLREASQKQLGSLRATEDGAFLSIAELDLHVNVDGLVGRLMEGSPATLQRVGAGIAGRTKTAAKAAAAVRNGQLGGRPRKVAKAAEAG